MTGRDHDFVRRPQSSSGRACAVERCARSGYRSPNEQGVSRMKYWKFAGVAAATPIVVGVGVAAPASATDNIQQFGKQEILKRGRHGDRLHRHRPRAQRRRHFLPGRRRAVRSDGHRRRDSGLGHSLCPAVQRPRGERADLPCARQRLDPEGLSGAAVPPGGSSTGKIFFDVVGDPPNSVVYNNGDHDLLAWVP